MVTISRVFGRGRRSHSVIPALALTFVGTDLRYGGEQDFGLWKIAG